MSRTEVLSRKLVTKDDVLNATNNGLDIYSKYTTLKNVNGRYVGLCPFHSERSGSFTVFGPRNAYKCFGCDAKGADAIKFLQEKEILSFVEALNMASKDFSVSPSTYSHQRIFRPAAEPMVIDFADIPFQKKHKDYWNQYLLPEAYLRHKNVFAVGSWAINRKKQTIAEDEAVFAYWAEDVDKVKILRIGPNIDKRNKWKNTVDNSYIWDLPKQKVQELWIIKSRKDELCMDYHFSKTSCALQNEDATLFLEHNYERVEKLSNRKVVCLGTDDQGWHESLLLTHLTGWEYFNTPGYMLRDGIEDIADVIAEFGLDPIKKDLIKKGYL